MMYRISRSPFIVLLLSVLPFIAYGAALTQDFSPIDDTFLIVNNLAIRGITLENLKTIFTTFDPELYIPFTLISFQIDYMIGGLQPFMFHLTNLILHSINSLFVYVLLRYLGGKKWISLIAAAGFAVHPLHTEAVAWIAGRKDLLSAFFYLGSFITYIMYRRTRSIGLLIISLIIFICALLSKVMVATLPGAIILYDVLIEKRGKDPAPAFFQKLFIIEKIPYVGLSLLFLIIAFFGKEQLLSHASAFDIMLMSGKTTLHYISSFLLPIHLNPFYPYTEPITLGSISLIIQLLIVIALSIASLLSWKKYQWFTFGFLFFIGTVAPTFPHIGKGSLIFFAVDRYMYLASIGLLSIIVLWWPSRDRSASSQNVMHSIGAVLIIVFTMLSIRQTGFWESPETLFARSLQTYPESISARTGLADYYAQAGRFDEAIAVLQDAPEDHIGIRLSVAKIYMASGQIDDAREQLHLARALDQKNPEPLYYLATLDVHQNQSESAIAPLEQAIGMDRSYNSARVLLGELLLEKGDREQATEHFTIALEWNPNDVTANANLGSILLEDNQIDSAINHLERSVAIDNGNVETLLDLAKAYMANDQKDQARIILDQVLKIDGQNTDAKQLQNQIL